MCICAWSLTHPDYALILCANRDEFLSRPTLNAQWHSFARYNEEPNILSGLDVLAGGTWLGINKDSGRIGLLTNITEPFGKYPFSRGSLLQSFLSSDKSFLNLEEEVRKFTAGGSEYAGFNLLLLAPSLSSNSPSYSSSSLRPEEEGGRREDEQVAFEAGFVTNSGARGPFTFHLLTSNSQEQTNGFSNGILGQGGESWPKVVQLSHSLEKLLTEESRAEEERILADKLFECLLWRSSEPIRERTDLRKTVLVDPILISSKGLSSSKPESSSKPNKPPGEKYYGTRLSSVLLIRRDGRVLFIERDVWKLGEDKNGQVRPTRGNPQDDRVFQFHVKAPVA